MENRAELTSLHDQGHLKSTRHAITTDITDEPELSATESAVITHIVEENRAFFRSQQINDPEITAAERRSICLAVWRKGVRPFLNRFSHHIAEEHLAYFENCLEYPADDEYEIRFHLADVRKRLKNRQRDVKNRRFAAMQKMINDTDCSYFDEHEMMAREPLLYEHLVGQYMTDTERKIRDHFDPNTEFSGVLLEGISNQHIKELQQKQQMDEERVDSTSESRNIEECDEESQPTNAHEDGIINDDYFPQMPPSFKKHWGDFEDDSAKNTIFQAPIASTSNRSSTVSFSIPPPTAMQPKRPDDKQKYITSSEKELLRNEFFDTMQANFLAGKDADFDYSTVDDNSDYDDVEQLNRDEEERYFDADDDDNEDDILGQMQESSISDESEDELDHYMKEIADNK